MAYGAAFITQTLAIFGIGVQLNILVWTWGVVIMGSASSIIAVLCYFMAYENAYALLNDAKYGKYALKA